MAWPTGKNDCVERLWPTVMAWRALPRAELMHPNLSEIRSISISFNAIEAYRPAQD